MSDLIKKLDEAIDEVALAEKRRRDQRDLDAAKAKRDRKNARRLREDRLANPSTEKKR